MRSVAAKKLDCFVISPIGDEGTETRKHADQVLKFVITPVLKEDYKIQRADKIATPGVITTQIVDRLLKADLVVADLTEHNANVFYELAVRHAFRKPFIQLISSQWRLPFDVAGMRTVIYDITDPDKIEEAKEELASQIAAVRSRPDSVETPISVALDINEMRTSGDLVAKSLAEIQENLAELRAGLSAVVATPMFTVGSPLTYGPTGATGPVTVYGGTSGSVGALSGSYSLPANLIAYDPPAHRGLALEGSPRGPAVPDESPPKPKPRRRGSVDKSAGTTPKRRAAPSK